MNKRLRRLLVLPAMISMIALISVEAYAAPLLMPDGIVFDPEYYAAQNKDVVNAFGTAPDQMWRHYILYGKKEGRLPAQPGAQPVAAVPGATQAPVPTSVQAPGAAAVAAQQTTIRQAAAQQASARGTVLNRYRGKKVSVIGDSISTFWGTMPSGYNSYYPQGDLANPAQTWWAQVAGASGMTLLSNASWTGSRVTGNSLSESGNPGCSTARVQAVSAGGAAPDVVFVYMGANDMFQCVPLGTYVHNKPVSEGANPSFADAYHLLLTKLQTMYPGATLICLTCHRLTHPAVSTQLENADGVTMEAYNRMIKTIAADHGVKVIDLEACGINQSNWGTFTVDGIHPNATGAALIAQYILGQM